jgi:hypothetical protein
VWGRDSKVSECELPRADQLKSRGLALAEWMRPESSVLSAGLEHCGLGAL